MMTTTSNLPERAVLIIVALVLIILGLFTFHIYPSYVFSKPLGSKLEYIGKTDYGCWLVCDSSPASVYYYATDMDIEEVTHSLFKKTTLEEKPQPGFTSLGNKEVADFWIRLKVNHDQGLYLTYYPNASELRNFYHLKNTLKPHVISIGSESYETAKDSLL